MGNAFVELPVPSANGAGADIDTSALGADKTIIVNGDFLGTVTIEALDPAGTNLGSIASFTGPGSRRIVAASARLRARMSGFKRGSAEVEVGSDQSGVTSVSPAVPAGNGVGASQDISALGDLVTVIVSGRFSGTVTIQVSQDGTDWSDLVSISAPRIVTKRVAAQRLRVKRSGVKADAPGLPRVNTAVGFSAGATLASNHNSLDEAYDQGGPGAGGRIIADSGDVRIQVPGVGTTQTFGEMLENPTDDGTEQHSPVFGLRGRVSDGFSVRRVTYGLQARVQQGGELPSLGDELRIMRDVDGGGFADVARIKNTGRVVANSYTFTGDEDSSRIDLNGANLRILASAVLELFGGSFQAAAFDGDGTAGNTRLQVFDVDNNALERVSVGAADSGGAGFKVLRIPN